MTGTANPQKGFGEFVPDADKIFHRADLIAAWLSTRHRLDPTKELDGQSFFVYRVIGGPAVSHHPLRELFQGLQVVV